MINLNKTPNLSPNEKSLSLEESNKLLNVYKEILEVVVTGNDFQFALDSLCKAAEGILPKALASIITYKEDRTSLVVRSAPNIPQQAIDDLNGLIPGEGSGSCAMAVYKSTPQFVFNTLTDPRWKNVTLFAKAYNINACWSMPILDKEKKVIGSFALSSFENGSPDFFQESLMETAAYLAGLVLLREKEESALLLSAHCDPLTGLPNRLLFNMRVEQAIAKMSRNNSELAIFFIDFDNFKKVNDDVGHDIGDHVLRVLAYRMQECIRKEDTLARQGGDEFVLLVEGFGNTKQLELIAKKIHKALRQEIIVENSTFNISASIGISLFPKDSNTTAKALIKCADQAMYVAKKSDIVKIHFYSQ